MSSKKFLKDTKYHLKKFRDFLNEDSLLSWIANIALAFFLIKFIVYPGLGLVFGTSYPIVAVVSGSMEHDGSFDDWWESRANYEGDTVTQGEYYSNYNITKDQFLGFRFKNGFNTGDIMILRGAKPVDLDVGDTIVFQKEGDLARREPIIHRVIEKNIKDEQVTFTTKGDHNTVVYGFETDIPYDNVIGKAILRIPYLGYVKIWFFELINLFR